MQRTLNAAYAQPYDLNINYHSLHPEAHNVRATPEPGGDWISRQDRLFQTTPHLEGSKNPPFSITEES